MMEALDLVEGRATKLLSLCAAPERVDCEALKEAKILWDNAATKLARE